MQTHKIIKNGFLSRNAFRLMKKITGINIRPINAKSSSMFLCLYSFQHNLGCIAYNSEISEPILFANLL